MAEPEKEQTETNIEVQPKTDKAVAAEKRPVRSDLDGRSSLGILIGSAVGAPTGIATYFGLSSKLLPFENAVADETLKILRENPNTKFSEVGLSAEGLTAHGGGAASRKAITNVLMKGEHTLGKYVTFAGGKTIVALGAAIVAGAMAALAYVGLKGSKKSDEPSR